MTSPEAAWLASSLAAARPRVISALLRVFRDLDTAEEAFQEASLRALHTWPRTGPPRDVAAWLILVGRNAALDGRRRLARQVPLPADDGLPERAVSDQGLSDPGLSNLGLSDLEDAETPLAEAIDAQVYRDEILRLLFICCHPELPVTQQIALALRIVAGLSVARIARAFLVSEAAMEQRISRAKARIARSAVPYGAPGAVERVERLAAVSAMLYLVFNAGYSAATGSERSVLCDEAIRLGRLLLRLFSTDPEVMGLLALMLLQHARSPARVDADGEIVLLEDQDRGLWRRPMIAEGLALVDKAMRHRRPGPYQVQAAIAALHARARRPQETDWAGIDALYAALERMQPSPVVTLNRAVATAKVAGPEAGLALVEPLAGPLQSYVHFHGLRGALLMQLGRNGEAREAMRRAIALAGTPAEAAHLRSQLDRLAGTGAAESEKI
ncbi:RNA polymerase sigma factor [Methylobacterium aquaticum]|uniref:RNA polymerase sigma factor n=1 Tax=Methylobacterium aquaticum TaxID=270351 RepID=UPI003D1687A8